MKIRSNFVSNSSSSSFVLSKKTLSAEQIKEILNLENAGIKYKIEYPDEAGGWELKENNEFILGCASMDNFQVLDLFVAMGISESEYAVDGYYNGHLGGSLDFNFDKFGEIWEKS